MLISGQYITYILRNTLLPIFLSILTLFSKQGDKRILTINFTALTFCNYFAKVF